MIIYFYLVWQLKSLQTTVFLDWVRQVCALLELSGWVLHVFQYYLVCVTLMKIFELITQEFCFLCKLTLVHPDFLVLLVQCQCQFMCDTGLKLDYHISSVLSALVSPISWWGPGSHRILACVWQRQALPWPAAVRQLGVEKQSLLTISIRKPVTAVRVGPKRQVPPGWVGGGDKMWKTQDSGRVDT